MAMQMQSLLVSPSVGSFGHGSRSKVVSSFGLVPWSGRQVGFRVRCLAEDNGPQAESKIESPSSSMPNPTPAPKPLPKVSTKFGDLLAFGGPAPERINGRLAMIGFVAAVAVELSSGTDLLNQISNGGGQWFLGTSILLSVASLVPLFKGKRAEAKTDGLMNSDAEIWNGRFAMLGLVALAFTEYVKGGALI
ncbi:early light-induced protein 2, chloroplastic-like [Silene latifolia]|uniref:early light-induced protein 2, chloroplastic-like n=1 Tax=Silene latifolia TaxID=37657 RepID=UPI003D787C80